MNAFSRGCYCGSLSRTRRNGQRLFFQLQFHNKPQRISLIEFARPCRSFATKSKPSPNAAKQKSRRSSPLAHITNMPRPAGPPIPQSNYAKTLARKDSPTLLYSNVGNGDYTVLIAAVTGAYCIGYGSMWIYDAFFVEHPRLFRPVNYMNGVGGLVMILAGLSVFTRMRGQVGRIQAVPLVRGGQIQDLLLRVEGRNWMDIPAFWRRTGPKQRVSLWKPVAEEYSIKSVEMQRRIADVKKTLAPTSEEEKRKAKEELRATDAAGGKHLLAPIKTGFWNLIAMLRKIVLGEGYVNLYAWQDGNASREDGLFSRAMKKKTFRMDVKSGWLLDDGLAMDKLLKP